MTPHCRSAWTPSFRERAAPWLPVPRVSARAGRGAPIAGICLLWVLAAAGAALVHLMEYHLGLNASGGRLASMAFMLAHCPVRGGLLVVLIVTVLTLCAVGHELRSLLGEQRRLTMAARRYHASVLPPGVRGGTRSLTRYVLLFLPILAGQAGLYALSAHLWPMVGLMRMHGAWMYMTAQGALPPLPLHLAVAAALAALAWRLERRFVALGAAIVAARRVLARILARARLVSLPASPPGARLSSYGGPAALSRPPPRLAAWGRAACLSRA